jgi:serine/threonine-protein kinase HipA
VIQVVNTWRDHFAQAGVSPRDLGALAERLDGGPLGAERRGFDPASYPAVRAARRRGSPFRRG